MTESVKAELRIKKLHKMCGFTQEKMVNDLFMSQSCLRKLVYGQDNPNINMVAKISSHLETALDTMNQEAL